MGSHRRTEEWHWQLALLLLVVGTILFHFLSPWWFTPIASNWTMMDDTVHITFLVTGIVFVAVNLFMAYAILRYRHRPGLKAQYAPENKKLEWWLTVVTSIGVAAMLAPGLFVWAKFVTVPKDASVVEVVGQQWNWSYRFPGRDGVLGTTDAKLITPDNPFGIDPKDPKGPDDILVSSQELHLPVNKPVKVLLRSKDVNHQFAVAQFRVKMDMVPGMVTYFWLTPTRTGRYDVLCEQLCGLAHFAMRGRVVVDEAQCVSNVVAVPPNLLRDRSPGRRQRRGGPRGLCGLQRLPRAAGAGQSGTERAEVERPGRLVPGEAIAAFQAGSPRGRRAGHLCKSHDSDGCDAG